MQISIELVLTVLNILLALLFWFMKDKIKTMVDSVAKVESKNAEIENNYIAKFDKVNVNIAALDKNLETRIGDLKLHLSETFMKKNECNAYHGIINRLQNIEDNING